MGASTRRADHPPESKNGLPVTFTLATTLKRTAGDPFAASGQEVLDAMKHAEPSPAMSARCLNPTCDQQCQWTETSGRPKKFCSDTCRQQHEKTRKRLEDEIKIIDNALGHSSTTPTQRNALMSQRSHRLFQLTRYPDVRGPRSRTSPIIRRAAD